MPQRDPNPRKKSSTKIRQKERSGVRRASAAGNPSSDRAFEAKKRAFRLTARKRLDERSQSARDHALHVLAAMRRDASLSLSRAAKQEGVKPETVKRYFPSALKKSHGRILATKNDRYQGTLYIPDRYGNAVPITTRSFKERQQASKYLRDLGRYLGGRKDALAKWHGKKIAGVDLVTAGRTIVAIEPALSEFSLYRAFNGGVA